MRYLSQVAALAAVAAALGPNAAQAATRYAVACVKNQTDVTVPFQVHSVGGTWATYSLAPGMQRSFWYQYKHQNENHSPILEIRFDSDLRNQQIFAITYKLPKLAAAGNSCGEGKPYAFRYERTNRGFIDLKAI